MSPKETAGRPVAIISGYLGAGKTTFINSLLEQAEGERITVLVNDFGSINIDANLIQNQSGETIALKNGCACCVVGESLSKTLNELSYRAASIDRLVIEASGVAKPERIVNACSVHPVFVDPIVLTLADATMIQKRASDKFVGAIARHQLKHADKIAVNRTEKLNPSELSALKQWFENLAVVPDFEGESLNPLALLRSIVPNVAQQNESTGAFEHENFSSLETRSYVINGDVNFPLLEEKILNAGDKIHRAKGVFFDRSKGVYLGMHWSGREVIWQELPFEEGSVENQLLVISEVGSLEGSPLQNYLGSQVA